MISSDHGQDARATFPQNFCSACKELRRNRSSSENSPTMKIRKAFVMSVNAGAEQEYEKRHNPIWPELEKVLKDHGVSNYSIFLHPETRQLFGYAEIESEEEWASIASTEVCQKWWRHMSSVMPSNSDHSPVSAPLREVFHLE